jgi:Zn-dependent protease/CBS domain-containing protein
MFGTRWRIFRILGIPFYLDVSWLVILALLTWTLAEDFKSSLGDGQWSFAWVSLGLVTAVSFFACILLHEMGHALVARADGMPVRGITLFLFGGVAELGGEPPSAGSEFRMAIAGPVVSLVLAGIFFGLARLGVSQGWARAATLVLNYLAIINLVVLVFNMVPAFPLDGGRVLRSILWGATGNLRRATYWASTFGQGFAWFLIILGIFRLLAGDFFGGFWMGLIGLFLRAAAQGSYQQVLIREVLEGEPIRRFMNPQPIVVPPTVDLKHWVDEYVYRYHRKAFPVASDGRLQGFITTQALAQFPRDEWSMHTVGELMRQDVETVSIGPDTDAMQALQKMQRTGSSRLLVTDGDQLIGIVSLKDLLRFLQLKLELEDGEVKNT